MDEQKPLSLEEAIKLVRTNRRTCWTSAKYEKVAQGWHDAYLQSGVIVQWYIACDLRTMAQAAAIVEKRRAEGRNASTELLRFVLRRNAHLYQQ